jgi:hypothetical protein
LHLPDETVRDERVALQLELHMTPLAGDSLNRRRLKYAIHRQSEAGGLEFAVAVRPEQPYGSPGTSQPPRKVVDPCKRCSLSYGAGTWTG